MRTFPHARVNKPLTRELWRIDNIFATSLFHNPLPPRETMYKRKTKWFHFVSLSQCIIGFVINMNFGEEHVVRVNLLYVSSALTPEAFELGWNSRIRGRRVKGERGCNVRIKVTLEPVLISTSSSAKFIVRAHTRVFSISTYNICVYVQIYLQLANHSLDLIYRTMLPVVRSFHKAFWSTENYEILGKVALIASSRTRGLVVCIIT